MSAYSALFQNFLECGGLAGPFAAEDAGVDRKLEVLLEGVPDVSVILRDRDGCGKW
jgi:hypothetical protein